MRPEARRYQIIRYLINTQTTDVIENSLRRIEEARIGSVGDIPENAKTISTGEGMDRKRMEMRQLLFERLYKHYRVVRMSDKASRFLKSLFMVYCDNPGQLPPGDQEKAKHRGKHQAICDYIAGMTDRYALDQYKKFFEPYERV